MPNRRRQLRNQFFAWIRGHKVLATLLVLGFMLRIVNVTWGIPLSEFSSFYHADEVKVWGSIVDFPENYFTSENYLYGTAIQYLVGTLLLPVKRLLLGPLGGSDDQYVMVAILSFRTCVAVMGTATIFLVYAFARRLFDRPTANLTALLLSVAPVHCLSSCFTTLDVPMSFLLVLCFLWLLRSTESLRMRDFVWLGLFSGVLMGTKVTGILFWPVPLLYTQIVWWNARKGRERQYPPQLHVVMLLLVYGLVAVGTFAVSTPHVVMSIGEFFDKMWQQKCDWYDRAVEGPFTVLGTWFVSSSTAAGIVVVVLSPAGVLFLRRPHLEAKWAVVLFCVVYYLFWQNYLPPRFVIFVVPLLCLLAAVTCNRLNRFRYPVGTWIAVGGFCLSLTLCLAGTINRWNDTRTQAARYIAETFKAGMEIGICTDSDAYPWSHHQWRYPRVDFQQFQERHFLTRPEIVIATSFERDQFEDALKSEKLLDGYLWDQRHTRDWYQHTPPGPAVFEFYDDLIAERSYVLLKKFHPTFRLVFVGGGPDVYVYRRRQE